MATITKRSTKPRAARGLAALAKAPTGIKDLDEVTGGGLPRGAGFLADVRQFRCVRPTRLGLEALFAAMQKLVCDFDPAVVLLDPISDLIGVGTACDVSAMLTPGRLPEGKGVTAMFTSLGTDGQAPTNHLVASLIDTWLLVRTLEGNGEQGKPGART
jgi:hypothetical protein